ncbi:nucleotidyltransferase family protein [Brevundimonas kwangchunensis]
MVRTYKQSCVHLWFENRFGEPCEALPDTDTALSRFVAPAFAIGIRLEGDDSISIAAPFGLEDMFAMVLRPNPRRPLAKDWDKAVASASARWPELRVEA